MKKVQHNRYNTATAVQHYLHEHADLYAGNAPMTTTVALLDAMMAQLFTQIDLQADGSKGATMDKKIIRKDLENQAFAFSSAACVFALMSDNRQLYRYCYYTKSDLLHFRDADLNYNCGELLRYVSEYATNLLPFGITPEMIAEFALAKANFLEIIDAPKYTISQKAQATAQIQVQITEIMNLIRLRLDRLVVSMIATQPEFVRVYKLLKRIKKVAARSRSLTVIVKDAETGEPLAEAELKTGNKIKRKTGVKGQSYVAHLPEGNFTLGVSLEGYDSQSLEYTVMAHQATKVEVLMRKTSVNAGIGGFDTMARRSTITESTNNHITTGFVDPESGVIVEETGFQD